MDKPKLLEESRNPPGLLKTDVVILPRHNPPFCNRWYAINYVSYRLPYNILIDTFLYRAIISNVTFNLYLILYYNYARKAYLHICVYILHLFMPFDNAPTRIYYYSRAHEPLKVRLSTINYRDKINVRKI